MATEMEGHVFRRRETDFFRRWTEFYLVLKDASLLIFSKKGEPSPKKTMVLTTSCTVDTEIGEKKGLYTFRVLYPDEKVAHYDPLLALRDNLSEAASIFKGETDADLEGMKVFEFGCRERSEAEDWRDTISNAIQSIRYAEKQRRARRNTHRAPPSLGIEQTPAQIQHLFTSAKETPLSPLVVPGSKPWIAPLDLGRAASVGKTDEYDMRGEEGQTGAQEEQIWSLEGAQWRLFRVVDGCAVWRLWEPKTGRAVSEETSDHAMFINNTVFKSLGLGLLMLTVLALKGYDWLALVGGLCVSAGILNGMAQSKSEFTPWTFYTGDIVRGSPRPICQALLNIELMPKLIPAVSFAEVVETINEYTDIIYLCFKPVWLAGFYARPRDVVLLRYWRKEEDGSRLVVYQSTTHLKKPKRRGFVRGHISAAAVVISPEHPEITATRGSPLPRSMVSVIYNYSPMGIGTIVSVVLRQLNFVTPWLLQVRTLQHFMNLKDFVHPHVTMAASNPDEEKLESLTLDLRGLVMGVDRIPTSVNPRSYHEPDGSLFQVRGANYLLDGVKVRAESSVFRLVAMDVFAFEDPDHRYSLCLRPDSLVSRIASGSIKAHYQKPPSTPAATRRFQTAPQQTPTNLNNLPSTLKIPTSQQGMGGAGSANEIPFTFVVNMVVPCADNLAVVMYFQPISRDWERHHPGFANLLKQFMEGDDEFRNNRFKLIPNIVEGSFILRKAVPSRPVIIGNKGLRMVYTKGPNWYEVDVDVASDPTARSLCGMALGATKSLTVDLAYLIEGQAPSELPESILGAVRFDHIDLANCTRVPKK